MRVARALSGLAWVTVALAGCRNQKQGTASRTEGRQLSSPRRQRAGQTPWQRVNVADRVGQQVPARGVLPSDGRLGAPLSKARAVPVGELAARFGELKGKVVKVSGKVVAWCRHRRRWFALGLESGKPLLTVRTVPRFLVPDGLSGRWAVAEGTLKVEKVDEAHARHLAKDHGFFGGDPAKLSGPQSLMVLQVRGASFQETPGRSRTAGPGDARRRHGSPGPHSVPGG